MNASELILSHRIALRHRIDAACEWLARQDVESAKSFYMMIEERFSERKPRIVIHLDFETMESARYWAARNLRDIFMPTPHYSGLSSYYAQEFPDFLVYCHFPIEQKSETAV